MGVGEDMLIDTVSDADVPIGLIPRREVFYAHANFRVAHVLVFSSAGKLLIQQIGLHRRRHPGYWGSSVAAYLYAGESYQMAAERRIDEELGVEPDLQYIGRTVMNDEGCNKFIGTFTAVNDGPFIYDHNHIEQIEFLALPVIMNIIRTGERAFTPTFLHVLNFYRQNRS